MATADIGSGRRRINAARGPALRCKGWRQEALLRMLENVLEVGERPEDLVVYAARAKAARNWPAFDAIVRALLDLEENETLVIQSGKPIAVFPSHRMAPLVLMANSNIVGAWATRNNFDAYEAAGLTVWGGYTAGDWQYIGSQGIVQGSYEAYAAVAREHFNGNLRGRLLVTAGMGGMGGAQPLAATMLGAACLVVEVEPERIQRRIATGYCEKMATDLDDALAELDEARKRGEGLSIALVGNAAEVLPELVRRGITPDVATDQTAAHDLLRGYVPPGLTTAERDALANSDPDKLRDLVLDAQARHMEALLAFHDKGAVVFEYGNLLRKHAAERGVSNAFDVPVWMDRYIRPLFCRGIGPFRWVAVSGEESDINTLDEMLLEMFPDSPTIPRWIPLARKHIRTQGLPARIAWLGHGERAKFAVAVNDAIAEGKLIGPIAFTRDHLDSGSVAQPLRETANMQDGSEAIADWPFLCALLDATGMADLVALHGGGAGYTGLRQSSGVTGIADGTPEARERLDHVFTMDSGIGVLRYADAGYPEAIDAVGKTGLRRILV